MNRQDKNYQKLYQYSIRKRNWGVGSVVVGIFLAGMLQAPTVLANTGATASEPTIENQADTGGGATGGSEVAQPVATTPAPGASTPESTLGNRILSEVSADKITLIGDPTHFEEGNYRGLSNILNADPGDTSTAGDDHVVADLKWSGRSLPEPVVFEFREASSLDHMLIYKRINNSGTLKKYKVEVFADGQEAPVHEETKVIENPHENDKESVSLSAYGPIKRVKVTFMEAVNRNGQPQNSALTIKEVSFFKESDIRGRQIETERLEVISDTAKFETRGGGRLAAKVNDGKLSTMGELHWNAQYTLDSAPITLQVRDGQSAKVTGVAVYKRPKNNGSLTKYKVETYNQEQLVETIDNVVVDYSASLSEIVLSGNPITKIIFTALEARDRNNNLNNRQLTVREIKLFEADPQEVAQPTNNGATEEQPTNNGATEEQPTNNGAT
ncbi:TPA: YSIRK-type signal peptide-containing protein, partial [Streptococcus suis]